MNTIRKTSLCIALAVCAVPAFAQQAYPTPEAAGDALVDALGTTKADGAKLATLLGSDWRTYVPEDSIDRKDVDAFLQKYRASHAYKDRKDGGKDLVAGSDGWVLPVPLKKGNGGWHFDLAAGEPEIRARRIGRNELDVEQAVRAYHDAQMDYAEEDRDGDGTLEYATKLVSTDGLHDGLYWAPDDSGEISPLGPVFGDDTPKGDYLGYHYRILTKQGPSAPGGAHDFMLGNDMVRGFALVAWPAKYGDTGVTTFMIGYDGQVFERNLGEKTDDIVKAMTQYDPDSEWNAVPEVKVAGN
ncbi:DUF2950 domain-containing protein [Lysobacter sp. 2RAF19]